MLSRRILSPILLCLFADTASFAANLDESVAPPMAPTWTVGLEGSPEFYAIDNASNSARSLADTYFKFSVSHNFDDSFIGGVFFQPTFKTGGKSQYFGEASLGYKIKLTDSFTLTPSLGLGYTWHDTGIPKDGNANVQAPYYVFYVAGDWKLTHQWTWNVFNLRYRNAFNAAWETPKVATGVTYNIDAANAIYTSIGLSWRKINTISSPYNDLSEDKLNIAIGYKYAF
ncbi:hypothetical protein [Mesorhizobium sp. GbtcB19]|uniref:hypothetical protein n=1 Tax=Mesorhizobium sp. GbtcB19 TaxID=2824764 RepID=UPI001C30EF10|nr:hypothetical protein [Mesorhizobium sp. GbtcB19]